MPQTAEKILITSALPYANGSIHIGHLLEYIQTDIWVRYLKMNGQDVVYVCADDTHGTPIEIHAAKLGVTPEDLVARYAEEHQRDFADFQIDFDCFYSTNAPENRRHVEAIFQKLKEQGHILTRPVSQFYCEKDQRFLPDRFIRGTCPNQSCQAVDQYGDACEVCGSTYDPTDLKDPRCAICGTAPVLRESDHYFLTLSAYTEFLRSWVATPGRLHPEVKRYIERWLDEGLRDWDISRDGPYFGFKIPGEEDKYFYVWLDAPVGYIATTEKLCRETGRDFDSYWHSESTKIYHVIGKDIVYFHTLFWPAVLKGAGFNLPSKVVVHGFLTVNGEKMSKSRGTFITARKYLQHLGPEYLRYYYAAKLNGSPEDLDLNLEDFVTRVNAELINKIANLVSRVVPFVNKNFKGRLGRLADEDKPLIDSIRGRVSNVREHYGRLEFNRAVQEIVEVADLANKFFQDSAPWELVKTDLDRARSVCCFAANCCRSVAVMVNPIVPSYAGDVAEILRTTVDRFDQAEAFDLEEHEIRPFRRLVERIECEDVTAMVASNLEAGPPEPDMEEPADPSADAFEPEITIDDFSKVDLRVATVLKAGYVEGADKLLELVVDLGNAQKTIFAGIRQSYQPDQLVGKQVIVVANLKPRKMRFGVSEGMLLAAGDGGSDVVVAEFGAARNPGQRVR